MAKSNYNEKDISFFRTELEKIRVKPNMYIGPTDDDGIFTIAREVLDNAVDEARAGRNDLVHFFITDKDFVVHDNGVGIPVKKHPQAKISTLTHVLTALQSSGKMKGDAYASSIGTHGVGIKCTNALSKSFEVWTFRKDAGGWHYTKFERGVEKAGVKKSSAPKLPNGKSAKKGTVVRWTPDEKIFGKSKFNMARIPVWAELTAYMNPGLRVILDNKGKSQEWFSKHGIREYLQNRITAMKANPYSKKMVDYSSKHLELAVAFADSEGDNMEFFTNTVRNVDKGFHADSFYKALFDSLKPYQGRNEYTPTDLREGLVGVLNLKIDAPKFSSQTKEKNVDERAQKPCYTECLTALSEFWKANKSFAKETCERAAELRKKTADFLKDKALSRNVKSANKSLSHKLAGVRGGAPIEQRELYLVEGDSAGGTAKMARFKEFQAVFPLKGKPLNVMEAAKDKINGNAEVATILAGVGIDPGLKDPMSKIQFGKIIFLADPDVDGRHINALLMGLFWKFLPSLYKNGSLYLVQAPEFMAQVGKDRYLFGDSPKEIYDQLDDKKRKPDIRHIKGWGELKVPAMREIAFQRGKRKLIQLTPPADKKGATNFQSLLGKDPTYRKRMLGLLGKEKANG